MNSKDYRQELKSFIESGRDNDHRKISHATYAIKTEDMFGQEIYGIQYHKTVVFGIRDDGEYFFNNGGYLTVTTKKRINDALKKCGVGDSIYQKNKVWHLGTYRFELNARLLFNPDNSVIEDCDIVDFWCQPNVEVMRKIDKLPSFPYLECD